jgi:uncharacterized protein
MEGNRLTTLEAPEDVNAPHVHTIRTVTGRYVDPMSMTADDVDIRDIAHALSRLCRFGGHAKGFLSVAQHSVAVSHMAVRYSFQVQRMALLHDATEAYLVDMPKPIKRRLPEYQKVEAHIAEAVAAKFGFAADDGNNYQWNRVHELDRERLVYEIDHLRDLRVEDGGGLWPDDARKQFCWRYEQLFGESVEWWTI